MSAVKASAGARAFLAGLIDYAGLFPPAALPLGPALAEYARHRAGPDAWMLGRFIVPAGRPEGRLTEEELLRLLDMQIAALPDQQREALILRTQHQYGYEAIGTVLGCTPDTAKVYVSLARKRLREQLRSHLDP